MLERFWCRKCKADCTLWKRGKGSARELKLCLWCDERLKEVK